MARPLSGFFLKKKQPCRIYAWAREFWFCSDFPRRSEQKPMYEVTVEADFSSGHYLRNYKGKCENPHGHNYKIRVTLAGTELDEAGLLLDFTLLKRVLKPVIDRIDHQMLNDIEPFIT